MELLDQAQAMGGALKALKDELHRHPELSFQERRTTALLQEKLTQLGLELVDLGMETGVVALLRGGKPGGRDGARRDRHGLKRPHGGDLLQGNGQNPVREV